MEERASGMKKHRKLLLHHKLAIVFAAIIACIMTIELALHANTVNVVREMTYEKMNSQAEYYQQTFETELEGILDLQLDFFNNRRLPFLASPAVGLTPYEEREAALNVQERIRTITTVSNLVLDAALYIPGNNYYISDTTIRRMTDRDWEKMNTCLLNADSSLQYDGTNFYSVRTGDTGNVSSQNPHYAFVLYFSSEQVTENLEVLNTVTKGGAFVYSEAKQVILENGTAETSAETVLRKMDRDKSGGFQSVQRITIGGKSYLVLVGGTGMMGTFVQYVEEAPLTEYITESSINMFFYLLGMLIVSIVFVAYTRIILHKPLNILIHAFDRMKQGILTEHIYHGKDDEFSDLYRAFNETEDRLQQLIDEVYVQKSLTQTAQLKQLQAQINPHFLYNSFFILSRRIKRQDYENAEEFAIHLGNYFKYLTRDGSDYISLRQEIAHARSYAAIQQARFASRVRVIFEDFPEKYGEVLVPRLIVQPLLENSFGHGLANKVQDGILKIRLYETDEGIRIVVEDNGEEATDEDIARMQASLVEQEPGEITGIVNIHRRLQIYFQGKAGLAITRSDLGGVAITICIDGI